MAVAAARLTWRTRRSRTGGQAWGYRGWCCWYYAYWNGGDINVEGATVSLSHVTLNNSSEMGLDTDGGTIDIENSELTGNNRALLAQGPQYALSLTINQTDMSRNAGDGMDVGALAGSDALTVTNSTIGYNGGTGMNVGGMGGNSTQWVTNDAASYNGGSGMNLGGMGGGSTLWAAGNTAHHDGGNGITVGGISSPSLGTVVVTGNTTEWNGGDGLAVTGMGGGSMIELTDNAIEHNAGPPLETDLSVDLTDSDLSGNTVLANGPGSVIEVDGSGTSGNVGFPSLVGTAFSAYLLRNTLQVNGGTTLTVQPGVTLYFESGSVMNVYGTLDAVGTSSQPITFTSVTGQAGTWDGIYGGGGGTVDLTYATVSGGGQAWGYRGWCCWYYAYWNGGDINVEGATVSLDYVTLTNSSQMGLDTDGGTIDIENSELTGNNRALLAQGPQYALSLTINQTDMSRNAGDGMDAGALAGSDALTVTNRTPSATMVGRG